MSATRYQSCERCRALPSAVSLFNLRHAPTPTLNAARVVERHGSLELEGIGPGGPEGLSEIYRCTDCDRRWNLLSWYALGCFDLRGHAPCPRCGERLAVRADGVFWGEVRLFCQSCETRFSIETSGDPPGIPQTICDP